MLTLGGGYLEQDYVAQAEGEGEFEPLEFESGLAFSTAEPGPRAPVAHELLVKRKDDAVARAPPRSGVVVLLKFVC